MPNEKVYIPYIDRTKTFYVPENLFVSFEVFRYFCVKARRIEEGRFSVNYPLIFLDAVKQDDIVYAADRLRMICSNFLKKKIEGEYRLDGKLDGLERVFGHFNWINGFAESIVIKGTILAITSSRAYDPTTNKDIDILTVELFERTI